ncbi:glycosyltransferase family 4 protein [Ichthyenterobacterium sp. W332]|uniref:Glycosyltransferase family 4 protein n=1 Tax=Microcosmobacter mediterraneus TaxID=3075607 RepID=A0ABU2YGU2_9FLAO|nr:glycosyltransferase family 4 protein [Ichthyenterobacterium sp. W332]MDT0557392.1 glycosyltransferase family 4 protein [Ichthyenterobacterium sp. W332]
MSKKVLIITYYWPPAGGPGVQRWLKFVKYLPQFGIEPMVYVPANPSYPIIDETLLSEIPDGISVLKQPILEPYKIASFFSLKKVKTIAKGIINDKAKQGWKERFLLAIRGNLFIPDARKSWVKPSVRYLSTLIEDFGIDTVISTGPPHSMHLIGYKLKLKHSIQWIADFRDPWTTIGYHKQLKLLSPAKKKHIRLESEVLNKADKIIVTSHKTLEEFESKTTTPVKVITNGFDDHGIIKPKKEAKFTLSHIGSLLSERNPEVLWKVLSELVKENEDFKLHFQLHLYGTVSESIIDSLTEYGLKGFVTSHGYVSHEEAIKAQMVSQVLLLIEIDSEDTKAIIPGKLFEYLASGTPILSIGPKNSEVETILKVTNTGNYFNYTSYSELKNQILLYFESYKTGTLQTQPVGVERYSRKALTKTLTEYMSWEL